MSCLMWLDQIFLFPDKPPQLSYLGVLVKGLHHLPYLVSQFVQFCVQLGLLRWRDHPLAHKWLQVHLIVLILLNNLLPHDKARPPWELDYLLIVHVSLKKYLTTPPLFLHHHKKAHKNPPFDKITKCQDFLLLT